MNAEWYMVEIAVSDWPRSCIWYGELLGLPCLMRDPAHQFALFGSESGRVALKAGTPIPGTATLVFRVDNLLASIADLAEAGMEPEAPVKHSHEGYRRAFFRDPDGYRVGLFDWGGTKSE